MFIYLTPLAAEVQASSSSSNGDQKTAFWGLGLQHRGRELAQQEQGSEFDIQNCCGGGEG